MQCGTDWKENANKIFFFCFASMPAVFAICVLYSFQFDIFLLAGYLIYFYPVQIEEKNGNHVLSHAKWKKKKRSQLMAYT